MVDDEGGSRFSEARRFELLGRLMRRSTHQLANVFAAMVGTMHLVELDLPPGEPVAESLQELRGLMGRGSALSKRLQRLCAMPLRGSVDVGEELDHIATLGGALLGLSVEVSVPQRPWTVDLVAVHLQQAALALLLDRSHVLDVEEARLAMSAELVDELEDAPTASPAWLRLEVTDGAAPLEAGAFAPELAAGAGGRVDSAKVGEGTRSVLWLPAQPG